LQVFERLVEGGKNALLYMSLGKKSETEHRCF
jgi:hypothetical protein